MTTQNSELKAKLNSETARIAWRELERHFAKGAVVTVSPGLDLIEVAAAMAADDTSAVSAWLADQRVHRTSADEATRWSRSAAELWCVVVAPWILVQETH